MLHPAHLQEHIVVRQSSCIIAHPYPKYPEHRFLHVPDILYMRSYCCSLGDYAVEKILKFFVFQDIFLCSRKRYQFLQFLLKFYRLTSIQFTCLSNFCPVSVSASLRYREICSRPSSCSRFLASISFCNPCISAAPSSFVFCVIPWLTTL